MRFVDLATQYQRLKPTIDARIQAVLDHGVFINGPEIDELEAALSLRAGCAHAVCVGSGTDALTIALLGEAIGPGDAVFVPSYTYMATANAVMLAGAVPIFVDVRADGFALDPEDLQRSAAALTRLGQLRPRAVIPVDLFGLPADYPAIGEVAERFELTVIADAAQSFGAEAHGRSVGALAPITATSFFPTKPLGGYGEGGALFTDDAARAARWRSIRSHGTEDDRMLSQRQGMNGRLDSLQAAILLAKLTLLDEELEARETLARLYDRRLAGHVTLPSRPSRVRSAWAIYAVVSEARDRLAAALKQAEVPTARYYRYPLHRQPAYGHLPAVPETLPVSDWLSQRTLCLPMHPYLPADSAHHICDLMIAALDGR